MALPILCYHKVGSEQAEGRWLNISPERLRSQIRFLKRRGYRFVTATEAARSRHSAGQVCLTFDDAYLSALTAGRQVLREEGVVGTFFTVGGQVGGASIWDGERARPLADWDLLRGAHAEGDEIGNHTMRHPDLSALAAREQTEEWREAQAALAEFNPVTGCYPYGKTNADSARALQEAGLALGFTLGKRWASPSDEDGRISRIPIAFGDSVALFWYRVFWRARRYSATTST